MPKGHAEPRPQLDEITSSTELRRWYWLKAELEELARLHGLSASGDKLALAARLVAHLDGTPDDEPAADAPRRADDGVWGAVMHRRPTGGAG